MLTLFRRIRKGLLSSGKARKYMVYAAGEVLLVMIGILLALQVNNWNEQRKRNLLRINILEELNQNLKDDIVDIDKNVGHHKRALLSSQIISNVIENELPYNDSLGNHFSYILVVPMFLPTVTAYENLKLAGTEILNNNSLRFEIIKLYERDYVFLKDVVDIERIKMSNDLNGLYRKEFSSLEFFGKAIPVDFDRLIKNQVYSNYVNYQKTISKFIIARYNSTRESTENLIISIDKELDKLD